jgi:lactoylglutathione lyase
MSRDPCRQTRAQIEYIALATTDLDRMRAFYVRLGGLASLTSTDPGAGVRSCALDFCGIRLELVEQLRSTNGATKAERSQVLMHLGFVLDSADSVDHLTRAIATAGHRVLEPPHRTGELGRYESVVLDPDGNRVKLTV